MLFTSNLIMKTSYLQNWVIRMPNFVKVDSKPYHPDTYMGPEHDDEEAHQAETLREKSMTIKLKVENTVRWRWVKDEAGQDVCTDGFPLVLNTDICPSGDNQTAV